MAALGVGSRVMATWSSKHGACEGDDDVYIGTVRAVHGGGEGERRCDVWFDDEILQSGLPLADEFVRPAREDEDDGGNNEERGEMRGMFGMDSSDEEGDEGKGEGAGGGMPAVAAAVAAAAAAAVPPAAAGASSDTAARLTAFESRCLGTPINIVEEQLKGIGFQLWPAATFLCRFLEDQLVPTAGSGADAAAPPAPPLLELPKPLHELNCLELGAGVGLVGLFMAGLGCESACVTDLAEVCPILQRNVDANPTLAGKVSVRPLAWGTEDWVGVVEERAPDLVLLADCVYWACLFEPLADTLEALCNNSNTTVIMAHTRRWKKDGSFFKAMEKRVDVRKLHEVRLKSFTTA